MKDRVICMMIGGVQIGGAQVVEGYGNEQRKERGGRGKSEGGSWNITERGKWQFTA